MKLLFMKFFLIVSSLTLLMTSKTLAYDDVDPTAPLPILKDAQERVKNAPSLKETLWNFLCWAFTIAFIIAMIVIIYRGYKYLKNRLD